MLLWSTSTSPAALLVVPLSKPECVKALLMGVLWMDGCVCACAAGKLYGAEAEPVGLLLDLNAGSLSVFQVRATARSCCIILRIA